jgi:Zn-dependent protease
VTSLEPFVWLIVFLISVSAHEAAHAWVAYLGGDRTAYLGGQVTLNPLPHMQREPFGMVVLPLIGVLTNGFPIGWASTPFDPAWEERYPRRAAWMSAAGPAANLALAAAALLFLKLGLATGFFFAPSAVNPARLVAGDVDWIDGMGRFTSMMLFLNTVLCLFNMIPFPPLDGASAITLLLPERLGLRVRQALRQPGFAIVGLLLVWFGFGRLIPPIFAALVRLVHS